MSAGLIGASVRSCISVLMGFYISTSSQLPDGPTCKLDDSFVLNPKPADGAAVLAQVIIDGQRLEAGLEFAGLRIDLVEIWQG